MYSDCSCGIGKWASYYVLFITSVDDETTNVIICKVLDENIYIPAYATQVNIDGNAIKNQQIYSLSSNQ